MPGVLKRTVRGVGYLGEGVHKPSLSCGKINPVYNRWKSLIFRCYDSESYHKNFSYSDAVISEEWLCFQNFAEWLTSQKMFSTNWQIDKDLSGMKTYGSEYCYLLPPHLNRALVRFEKENKLLGLPIGVVWHKKNQVYIVNSPNSNESHEYVSSFHTLESALKPGRKQY